MEDYRALADSELFGLLKADDRRAFREIYERYKYVLQAHAVNQLRDREEARDIIQDVFIYLWDRREQVSFSGGLSGYLYGAVRHAVLNRVARGKVEDRYIASMLEFSGSGQVETDHLVREHQLRELISKEVAALPLRMREVFELSRYEHLSHKEIAERLGISEQTVSKQVSNAMKILRDKLGVIAFIYMLLHP